MAACGTYLSPVLSVFVARAKELTVSAAVGLGTGCVLLGAALLALVDALVR